MRQLVYTMFITNNHDSFHLCRHKNFLKHQNVSKYYDQIAEIKKYAKTDIKVFRSRLTLLNFLIFLEMFCPGL